MLQNLQLFFCRILFETQYYYKNVNKIKNSIPLKCGRSIRVYVRKSSRLVFSQLHYYYVEIVGVKFQNHTDRPSINQSIIYAAIIKLIYNNLNQEVIFIHSIYVYHSRFTSVNIFKK